MRARRAELTARQRREAEQRMVEHFQQFLVQGDLSGHPPKNVFAYAAVPPEAPTSALIETLWRLGTTVCLPRLNKARPGDMEAVPVVSWDELVPGPYFGILQPSEDGVPLHPAEMDLIVVPGVGFDQMGRRLGQAGGYYDRMLARVPSTVVRLGWAFAVQLVDELPEEPHDERVDVLVTEQGIVKF